MGYRDLLDGFKLYRYWLYSAFIKFQIEHQKTRLSILWGPLTALFVSSALALVWSEILGVESRVDYFFYVLIGFSIWSLLISKLVNRAVSSIARRSKELRTSVRPISSLFLEDIAYSFLNFFTIIPVMVIASVLFYDLTLLRFLHFFIGLCLTALVAVGLCYTLGVLMYFVRDVLHVVKAVMRLGFLVTPIIWMPERLGDNVGLILLNPFFSFIEICRAPLLGTEYFPGAWEVAIFLALTISIIGLVLMNFTTGSIRKGVFL